MKKNKELQSELRLAGASDKEARELTQLASRLKKLQSPRTESAPQRKRSAWARLLPTTGVAVVALLLGMSSVTLAQSSLPGSLLYPVKRLSENAAVTVDPSYRATLMMRRANEVEQLIGKRASTKQVLTMLGAYNVQASAYKSKNYAAFAYCKSNLQLAMADANSTEKQAITITLNSLQDVD